MFEKLYKFKVLFKWAFKHLRIKFLVIFLILNMFAMIDILQGNTQWINLVPINIALSLLYVILMIYLMYPPISGSRTINNGKKWDVKVPIKATRKYKLKKLNKL